MLAIHTSDWHLGAALGEASRLEEQQRFLQWLGTTIRERGVDTLLVAGDIFDQANPSAEAQRTYYTFLRDLGETGLRQVILTGGNHDSPSRLDAPSELLGNLGIHVVGGLDADPESWGRCLCPLRDAGGAVEAVVAAAPFVHEWRLGFRTLDGTPEERGVLLAACFRAFYGRLADLAEGAFPGVPLLAMGHLACVGSTPRDAPLETHLVGTLGALPADIFDERFAYVALGHIHRNYAVAGGRAHYCGTPLALNAREGATARQVNLVRLEGGALALERLPVPAFRQVLEFAGTPDQVRAYLEDLAWTEPLPAMLSLEVCVERHQPGLEDEVRALVAAREPRPLLVGLQQTLVRRGDPEGGDGPAPSLESLEPRDVFRLLCKAKGENADELMAAFETLLGEENL
ncbi:metallophosphoesterase family protein [Mesoterricola silvestris]|uniref:Nuclease SbcCD subunit D n=1 Tax=Mesoterricola silvestris TaxID=2927979 RepID=A0AA48K7U7_9BACT|nr:exonuclease subunit SbcD [Mesoterricola silvestris]BDU72274.1 nuclease SbcCD subunit D [Mesoterricola silvestris]